MLDNSITWPTCDKCGGANWKVNRSPHKDGFEDQFFTCAACGNITERRVRMRPDDDSLIELS